MDDKSGYAVFFFPQAIEALGDAIKPFLQEGPTGAHVFCRSIDTGGALIEMTLDAQTTRGETTQMELMVPSSMVRMIVSSRIDESFGFGPRIAVPMIVPAEVPTMANLPQVGPAATPAATPPESLPAATETPESAPAPAKP